MRKIKNKSDVNSERLRLQMELNRMEDILKDDLVWVKNEIQPEKIAGRIFKNIFSGGKNGLVNEGVRFTADSLVRNILFKKSGWLVKLIVPFFISNISSGLVSDKKSEIFGLIRDLIHKARKNLKNDETPFDKSTVDEMDY